MRLAGVMTPFTMLGTNPEDPADDAQRHARITELRIGQARRYWEEIPSERLERRDRYWIVDVQTDAVFAVYKGVTFERSSARLIADHTPGLAFYVGADGSPVALERQTFTWSEHVARRSRRSAGKP